SKPASRPSSVDLPDPELPVMAKARPCSTVKLTLSKIVRRPVASGTVWHNCLTSIGWSVFMWIRRYLTLTALSLFLMTGALPAAAQGARPARTILVVGDSLSAEYGLQRG